MLKNLLKEIFLSCKGELYVNFKKQLYILMIE